MLLKDVLTRAVELDDTSRKRLEDIFARSIQDVFKTSWRRLEDILKTFFKTSWRYLEDVFQDVLKTSWRRLEDVWPRWIYWSWPRRLEDVFWRRKAEVNIFVLIKTSSEDEDERRLQDVFIKTNVCWASSFWLKFLNVLRDLFLFCLLGLYLWYVSLLLCRYISDVSLDLDPVE